METSQQTPGWEKKEGDPSSWPQRCTAAIAGAMHNPEKHGKARRPEAGLCLKACIQQPDLQGEYEHFLSSLAPCLRLGCPASGFRRASRTLGKLLLWWSLLPLNVQSSCSGSQQGAQAHTSLRAPGVALVASMKQFACLVTLLIRPRKKTKPNYFLPKPTQTEDAVTGVRPLQVLDSPLLFPPMQRCKALSGGGQVVTRVAWAACVCGTPKIRE